MITLNQYQVGGGDLTPMQLTTLRALSESADLLRLMPFQDVEGGGHTVIRRSAFPNVSSRAINSDVTASSTELGEHRDPLKVYTVRHSWDRALTKMHGDSRRSLELVHQIEAMGLTINKDIIKGDPASNGSEIGGLQYRLTGSQKISVGGGSGATALSLENMLEAKRKTYRPTHWIIPEALADKIEVFSHSPTTGGATVTRGPDEMGVEVTRFLGLPIIRIGEDAEGNDVMPFTELADDGGADGNSVYCVHIGPFGMHGIQAGPPETLETVPSTGGVLKALDTEWLLNFSLERDDAATRLWSIADAAITLS